MIAFSLRLPWNKLTHLRPVSSEMVVTEGLQYPEQGSGGGPQGRHLGAGETSNESLPGSIGQSPGQPQFTAWKQMASVTGRSPSSLMDVYLEDMTSQTYKHSAYLPPQQQPQEL